MCIRMSRALHKKSRRDYYTKKLLYEEIIINISFIMRFEATIPCYYLLGSGQASYADWLMGGGGEEADSMGPLQPRPLRIF